MVASFYKQGARFTGVKWHFLVTQQTLRLQRLFVTYAVCFLSVLLLCTYIFAVSGLACTLNTQSLAWLLSCLLKIAASCCAVSVSADCPCFAAAAARMSYPNNSSDLATLAQELPRKELSGEIEEQLSRAEQVEGDLITMHKSDCSTLQSRTACLREPCMPRVQEEPSV